MSRDEQLAVDPIGLRSAVSTMAELSSLVERALRQLDSVLDSEGDCWGADDVGNAFAGSYLPAVDQVRSFGGSLAVVLTELGGRLDSVVAWAEAADRSVQTRFGG